MATADQHLLVGMPTASYAPGARAAAYVRAMERLAEARRPEARTHVYLSAPPSLPAAYQLELTRGVRKALPDGVHCQMFSDAFQGRDDYLRRWPSFTRKLNALVLVGRQPRNAENRVTIGPTARAEVRRMLCLGRPVLLYTRRHGLVPLVDCSPIRPAADDQDWRQLKVPGAWQRHAPTLSASLLALTPLTHRMG
ncbi:hypothetical protein ACFCZ4_17510 [Streptomyces microflavus]|uniref:hypothetical protein n=1 Tax=Streptomyces TaxID=1883 RepID=UPI002E79B9A9|nr:hypothetical protein [Streptomyces sp. BE282]MEE1730692.1 hypothetical protein [Streptomyces sp. BE282]